MTANVITATGSFAGTSSGRTFTQARRRRRAERANADAAGSDINRLQQAARIPSSVSPMTPFPDLDAVLADLRRSARIILGTTYIGTYLQGSFALGAGDAQSDADFVVVVEVKPTHGAEDRLRQLHSDIPTRPGIWNRNIEGSYADAVALWSGAGLGVPWLFNGHGQRTLEWDTHCNNLYTRWILRNHGIIIDGPPIRDLVDDVPKDALPQLAAADLPGTLLGITEWAPWITPGPRNTSCRRTAGSLHGPDTPGRIQAGGPHLGDGGARSGVAGPAAPGRRGPGPAVAAGRPTASRQHAASGRLCQICRDRRRWPWLASRFHADINLGSGRAQGKVL